MELRHLKYFIAVAEELNFSRAAERLHVSQPPLSQQIKQLEEEVKVQLLDRSTRSVRLTSAGRLFLEHARQILAQVESAVLSAREGRADETTGSGYVKASRSGTGTVEGPPRAGADCGRGSSHRVWRSSLSSGRDQRLVIERRRPDSANRASRRAELGDLRAPDSLSGRDGLV